MRRHDHTRCCRPQAIPYRKKEAIMKTLWLLGGLGLGAGLMYLLDPEKGVGRRDRVRGYVEDYGRQTGALLDDTRRTLGRQARAALATRSMPFSRLPELGERPRTQAEARGLPVGLGLIGCIGLGVGLGYLLEPQGGPQRRAWLREQARAYWQTTETVLSSAVPHGVQPPKRQRQKDAPAAHQA
jgi:hypothetical protein